MEKDAHKGNRAKGQQSRRAALSSSSNMFQGSQTTQRVDSSQDLSRIPTVPMPFLGPVLGRIAHSCLWPLSPNEKQKSCLGRKWRPARKKSVGVASTGPRTGWGHPAQQCPCHQRIHSGQSRTQLRPFTNKYCFRPKCVDLRSCGFFTFPWQCRPF